MFDVTERWYMHFLQSLHITFDVCCIIDALHVVHAQISVRSWKNMKSIDFSSKSWKSSISLYMYVKRLQTRFGPQNRVWRPFSTPKWPPFWGSFWGSKTTLKPLAALKKHSTRGWPWSRRRSYAGDYCRKSLRGPKSEKCRWRPFHLRSLAGLTYMTGIKKWSIGGIRKCQNGAIFGPVFALSGMSPKSTHTPQNGRSTKTRSGACFQRLRDFRQIRSKSALPALQK